MRDARTKHLLPIDRSGRYDRVTLGGKRWYLHDVVCRVRRPQAAGPAGAAPRRPRRQPADRQFELWRSRREPPRRRAQRPAQPTKGGLKRRTDSRSVALRLLAARLAGDPVTYALAMQDGGDRDGMVRVLHEIVDLLALRIEHGGHPDAWQSWIERQLGDLLDALDGPSDDEPR